MARKVVSSMDHDTPVPLLRRSRRIQAMQQNSPTPQARLKSNAPSAREVKDRICKINESLHKRKRKVKDAENDGIDASPAKKHRASPPDNSTVAFMTRPLKSNKRRVHFEDGELEPIIATPSPMERAQTVSVEYLASQTAKSNIPEGDIRKVACPEEAQPSLEPIRIEGRKGDYLRYPPIFVLAYPYPITSIFQHLQARGRDVEGDIALTLAALRKRVQTELGMKEGYGFARCSSDDGRSAYVFIASWSDRPETLPYPEARIRKIQEILDVKDLPSVLPYRCKNKRL
ncbi:hypothetical protein BD626DRAFT_119764 [Schizophyllum amplum]|uniref:Uncharacterized protein n=1 Tax=Schizophyllum amplum TaxID=97359 RepID=A0A550CV85_9AGAR|nr:hypothetical protein BD626DRAFT_119764 [Auriculariopsis ampla]